MPRKVCIAITTRGNYAKMKSVIRAIEARPGLELEIVAGGMAILPRFGNTAQTMRDNNFRVDREVHFLVEGENPAAMAKSGGLAVIEFATIFGELKPDVVVVIADRFECLAIAMAASYLNIPLAHVEGGEISGSVDECIRHAITKLSHLHFPANPEAAQRIVRLGEDPATVFTVGATSLDAMRELDLEDMGPTIDLQEKLGQGPVLDLKQPYLVVIQHPVTTEYAANREHVDQTVAAIEELGINTVWIGPNMDAGSDGVSQGIRHFCDHRQPAYVHFLKSLPIEHYAPLLRNAACLVGNSSSGIRESAFLGTPTVNIGTRQVGRQRGANVIDVGYDREQILGAIRRQLEHGRYEPDHIYGAGDAGYKMAEVLETAVLSPQKRNSY